MFTIKKLLAVIATMAIALLMVPGAASAQTRSSAPTEIASANGYPDCLDVSITLSPSHPRLVGGGDVTITASVTSNVDPQPSGTLVIKVLGKTHTFHSNSATITVKTPTVLKKTSSGISASYTLDSGGTSATCYIDPPDAIGTLTLLPAGAGNDGNGALPNTGGTNLWYLVAGAALLAFGVGIVGTVNSRRSKKLI